MVAKPVFKYGFEEDSNTNLTKNYDSVFIQILDSNPVWNPDSKPDFGFKFGLISG